MESEIAQCNDLVDRNVTIPLKDSLAIQNISQSYFLSLSRILDFSSINRVKEKKARQSLLNL